MRTNKVKKIICFLLVVLLMFTYTTNVEAASMSEDDLNDLQNFVVGDMWNDGVCDFSWYFHCRTNACGEKMNPEKTLVKFNKTMKKAKKWDKRITKLKGKKYKKLKKHWKLLYLEAKNIQKRLKKTNFKKLKRNKKDYDLDVEDFNDLMYDIESDIDRITYKPEPEIEISVENIDELDGFIVGDLWNDAICNFNWYFGYRTNACGRKMNPEKTLSKFNKDMKKAKKWDNVVKNLSDSKYNNLKKHWKILYSEAKRLQRKLNNTDFDEMKSNEKEYKLNVTKFETYMYKISNDFYEIDQ